MKRFLVAFRYLTRVPRQGGNDTVETLISLPGPFSSSNESLSLGYHTHKSTASGLLQTLFHCGAI